MSNGSIVEAWKKASDEYLAVLTELNTHADALEELGFPNIAHHVRLIILKLVNYNELAFQTVQTAQDEMLVYLRGLNGEDDEPEESEA